LVSYSSAVSIRSIISKAEMFKEKCRVPQEVCAKAHGSSRTVLCWCFKLSCCEVTEKCRMQDDPVLLRELGCGKQRSFAFSFPSVWISVVSHKKFQHTRKWMILKVSMYCTVHIYCPAYSLYRCGEISIWQCSCWAVVVWMKAKLFVEFKWQLMDIAFEMYYFEWNTNPVRLLKQNSIYIPRPKCLLSWRKWLNLAIQRSVCL